MDIDVKKFCRKHQIKTIDRNYQHDKPPSSSASSKCANESPKTTSIRGGTMEEEFVIK
jgi:hypothetical protein